MCVGHEIIYKYVYTKILEVYVYVVVWVMTKQIKYTRFGLCVDSCGLIWYRAQQVMRLEYHDWIITHQTHHPIKMLVEPFLYIGWQ